MRSACLRELFQTLTNNPILTPSILGFDSLYVFLQTLLVFTLGGVGYSSLPLTGKFGFELVIMMGGSLLLFYTLIKQGGRDLSRMIFNRRDFRDFVPQPVVSAFRA